MIFIIGCVVSLLLLIVLTFMYIHVKSCLVNKLSEVITDKKYTNKENSCKIKIITQNLWCHYLVKVGPNSHDRIKAFISQVKDYDVVLLQEVFILRIGPLLFSGWASFVVAEFKKYGFVYHTSFLESVPYFFGQNNGVAIFSKIPISETGTVTFEKSIFDLNGDYLNNKGFVWARVRLANQKSLLFLSVHMSAVDDKMNGCYIKKKEIHAIKSFIDKFEDEYIVLAGDFNTCSHRQKSEYEKLESSLSSLNDIVSKESLNTFYNSVCDVHETLDLIFVSSSLKYTFPWTEEFLTENEQPVSDHLAVSTEIICENAWCWK